MSQSELKRLQVQQTEAEAKLADAQARQKEISHEVNRWTMTLGRITKNIEALKRKEDRPFVTEHAILRYIERVLKLDLEEIKEKLAVPGIAWTFSGSVPLDGYRVVIKEGTVITVLTKDGEKH